ncbi:MAG TPA: arginase family protein [Polyangiaceae bacterium]|nr:arginase family protein [Polyangiaceae bacterium]
MVRRVQKEPRRASVRPPSDGAPSERLLPRDVGGPESSSALALPAEPAYATVPSFFGLPRPPSVDPVPAVDVLLSGLPYDGGALYRSGGRFSPRAVRDASTELGSYSEALGIGVWDEIRAADGGDVAVAPDDLGRALDAIARRSEAVARSGVIGGWVGGDQTVTLGVLRGIHRAKLKAVGLVHIDSCTDTLGPAGSRDVHQHSVLRNAADEGLIRPHSVVQVGIRGPHAAEREVQLAVARGFEIVKVDDVKWDIHSAISQIRKIVREGSLYVTVDVSVLDPAFAPGASTARPGGMNTWELQQVLRALVGAQIVGFDVVEVCPPYDPSGVTALAAASVLHELLAVIADTHRSARPAPSSAGRRRGKRLSP